VQGFADGDATTTRFMAAYGITMAQSTGLIFVVDQVANVVRRITPGGICTTIAGTPGTAGNNDGPAATAMFDEPRGLTFDRTERYLYIAVLKGHVIKRLDLNAMLVVTVVGTGHYTWTSASTSIGANITYPIAVCFDVNSNRLFIGGPYAVSYVNVSAMSVTQTPTVPVPPSCATRFCWCVGVVVLPILRGGGIPALTATACMRETDSNCTEQRRCAAAYSACLAVDIEHAAGCPTHTMSLNETASVSLNATTVSPNVSVSVSVSASMSVSQSLSQTASLTLPLPPGFTTPTPAPPGGTPVPPTPVPPGGTPVPPTPVPPGGTPVPPTPVPPGGTPVPPTPVPPGGTPAPPGTRPPIVPSLPPGFPPPPTIVPTPAPPTPPPTPAPTTPTPPNTITPPPATTTPSPPGTPVPPGVTPVPGTPVPPGVTPVPGTPVPPGVTPVPGTPVPGTPVPPGVTPVPGTPVPPGVTPVPGTPVPPGVTPVPGTPVPPGVTPAPPLRPPATPSPLGGGVVPPEPPGSPSPPIIVPTPTPPTPAPPTPGVPGAPGVPNGTHNHTRTPTLTLTLSTSATLSISLSSTKTPTLRNTTTPTHTKNYSHTLLNETSANSTTPRPPRIVRSMSRSTDKVYNGTGGSGAPDNGFSISAAPGVSIASLLACTALLLLAFCIV
jgi:hypothetical protein